MDRYSICRVCDCMCQRREEEEEEEEEKRGLPEWIERCFELVSVFSSFVPAFRGVQGAGGLSLSLFHSLSLSLSLLRVSWRYDSALYKK